MFSIPRLLRLPGASLNGFIYRANALQQYNGVGLYRLSTGSEHKGDQDSKKYGFLKGLTGAALFGAGVWSIGKMLVHEKVQKDEMAKSRSGFKLRNIIGLKKLTGCFIGDENRIGSRFSGLLDNELKNLSLKFMPGVGCMEQQPPPPPFQLIRHQYAGVFDYDTHAREILMRYWVKPGSAFARLELFEQHSSRTMVAKMYYHSMPAVITVDYFEAIMGEMNNWFEDHGMTVMTQHQLVNLSANFMQEFTNHGEIEQIVRDIRNRQERPQEFEDLPHAFALSNNRYPAEVDFELIIENLQQNFQGLLVATPSFVLLNQLVPTLNLASNFMATFVVYKMPTHLTREYFLAIIDNVNEHLVRRRRPFFGENSIQVLANVFMLDLAQRGPLFMLLSAIQTVQNHPHRFMLPDYLYPVFIFENFAKTEAEVITEVENSNELYPSKAVRELDDIIGLGLNRFFRTMVRYAVPEVTGMQYVLFLVQKFQEAIVHNGGRRMTDVEITKVLDTFWWELYNERGFYNVAQQLRAIQNPGENNPDEW